ncbi:MAG: hypothetical protein ACLGPL_11600 [Acidobacteriota bacterium]
MAGQDQLDAVRQYLVKEFPDGTIDVSREQERKGHSFTINRQGSVHLTTILDEFLDGRNATEIPSTLSKFLLAEHLRDMAGTRIIVTGTGLSTDV